MKIIRFLFSIVIVSGFVYCQKLFIISDYDFTNTCKYSEAAYVAAFSAYQNKDKIIKIVNTSIKHGINPVVLFITAQKESSWLSGSPTRSDYIMGAGVHKDRERKRWKSFDQQVVLAAQTLSNHFYTAHKSKYMVKLYCIDNKIKVSNRATYALYMYTPRWREEMPSGVHGNFNVPILFKKYTHLLDNSEK